uniref:Glutaredoxin-like protein n=1 Tax=Varanus komodoensis TaxID=61221 RepID=A0A8D2LLG4_VARKO
MYHACNCRGMFYYFSRVTMFWLQSWTLQLAKCSRPPLRRLLCDARTNLPVLMLFTKFILQEVDITLPDHSAWFEKYKYDIPVFHLNGQFLMKHQVDIQKLENELCKLGLQDHVNR